MHTEAEKILDNTDWAVLGFICENIFRLSLIFIYDFIFQSESHCISALCVGICHKMVFIIYLKCHFSKKSLSSAISADQQSTHLQNKMSQLSHEKLFPFVWPDKVNLHFPGKRLH